MEAKEYIQRQIAVAWRTCDEVIEDLTDEQLNWTPPGKANPISATLAHIIGGEDTFVQAFIQGKPRIWQTQGWSEKLQGVTAAPGPGTYWNEYLGKKFTLDTFKAYRDAVRPSTRSYLEGLSDAELQRKSNFPHGERPVVEVLTMLVNHIIEHSGEIAALKGVQGAKGLAI